MTSALAREQRQDAGRAVRNIGEDELVEAERSEGPIVVLAQDRVVAPLLGELQRPGAVGPPLELGRSATSSAQSMGNTPARKVSFAAGKPPLSV